jgi:hypothetical protein
MNTNLVMPTQSMQYSISDEILKKTTKCGHNFSCLSTGKCGNLPKCNVEKCFDKNMLFVETRKGLERISCPYNFSYGSSLGHICICPTHYVVYMQNECYNECIPRTNKRSLPESTTRDEV